MADRNFSGASRAINEFDWGPKKRNFGDKVRMQSRQAGMEVER